MTTTKHPQTATSMYIVFTFEEEFWGENFGGVYSRHTFHIVDSTLGYSQSSFQEFSSRNIDS